LIWLYDLVLIMWIDLVIWFSIDHVDLYGYMI